MPRGDIHIHPSNRIPRMKTPLSIKIYSSALDIAHVPAFVLSDVCRLRTHHRCSVCTFVDKMCVFALEHAGAQPLSRYQLSSELNGYVHMSMYLHSDHEK